MGRKCRCCITNQIGTTDTFYRAADGRYYATEEIYLTDCKRKEAHKELIDTLVGFLGYEKGMIFPTVLSRKLKELSFYGDEVILATARECKPKIDWAFETKGFDNEYNRIAYMMAIIKGHINDVYLASRNKDEDAKETETMDASFVCEARFEGEKNKRDISSWLGGDA